MTIRIYEFRNELRVCAPGFQELSNCFTAAAQNAGLWNPYIQRVEAGFERLGPETFCCWQRIYVRCTHEPASEELERSIRAKNGARLIGTEDASGKVAVN